MGDEIRKHLWMYVYQEKTKPGHAYIDQLEFLYAVDEREARIEAMERIKDLGIVCEIELKQVGSYYATGGTILDETLLCNPDGTPKERPFHDRLAY